MEKIIRYKKSNHKKEYLNKLFENEQDALQVIQNLQSEYEIQKTIEMQKSGDLPRTRLLYQRILLLYITYLNNKEGRAVYITAARMVK